MGWWRGGWQRSGIGWCVSGPLTVRLLLPLRLHMMPLLLLLHSLGEPPLLHLLAQHIHQGTSGAVLHMQHTSMAVGRLQRGGQCTTSSVEGHAELLQPLDAPRCLIHQQPHSITVAEPCSRPQRVFAMTESTVLRPGHRRDAPLSPSA